VNRRNVAKGVVGSEAVWMAKAVVARYAVFAETRAGVTGSRLAFCIGNLVVHGRDAPGQLREDLLGGAGRRFTPEGVTTTSPLLLDQTSTLISAALVAVFVMPFG
jgi:hypothetical protein